MSVDPADLFAALAAGDSVSGSELARRFGVTRAAIWKQMQGLRALGAAIDARAGDGYRLDPAIAALDRGAIRAALAAPARARIGEILVRWETASTNAELLARTSADPHPVIACVAEIQTHGRGRRGRAWQMPLGGGLALSLRYPFESGMSALGGLSLAVGVALVRALGDAGFDRIGLKWPNDVIARGRKLAGILIELGGDALGPCHAVIGIGLNLRLNDAVLESIDQPAIDLARLALAPPDRNHLAARVLSHLVDALDQFQREGFAPFAAEFARHDVLAGQRVRVLGGGIVRDGIAIGVDERGMLRVQGDRGEFAVDSGEISVRADADPRG